MTDIRDELLRACSRNNEAYHNGVLDFYNEAIKIK